MIDPALMYDGPIPSYIQVEYDRSRSIGVVARCVLIGTGCRAVAFHLNRATEETKRMADIRAGKIKFVHPRGKQAALKEALRLVQYHRNEATLIQAQVDALVATK